MTNLNEQNKPETRAAVAGRLHTFVIRGCAGTHGGINRMCDHCANYIGNYHGTLAGTEAWKNAEKIDEIVCRLPIGEDQKFWTQFISKLQIERNKTGLSLQGAADIIGCTKTHLHYMEKGRSNNPSVAIINGLRRAYSMTADELLDLYA